MNTQKKYTLVILCVALLRTVALADPTPGTLLDKVIAYVGDEIILQSELEVLSQQYILEADEDAHALRCKMLDQLIISKALAASVKREKVVVEKETVNQFLNDRMQYLLSQAGSEEALVQSFNKPIDALKSALSKQIEEQLMIEKMRTKLIQEVTVSPKEVKDFFHALPTQERPYYPDEVVVRQIVCHPQVSQQERNALTMQLQTLKTRMQEGEDFELLAREYSQDPLSASQGGDIGFWRLGELPLAYETAALALQPGEISAPVFTQSGGYLIQLIAREEDRYSSRHILLEYDSWNAARERLIQLRTDILAGKLTFEQAAMQYSEDPLAASNGGLITNEEGSVGMFVDRVPPDVYFSIEGLIPGAISDPISFTTADDREAVRLIFLEKKIASHYANLVQDYAKIRKLVLNKKSAAALEQWVQHAKASTFIRVAPEYRGYELLK
ncbi:MAG: peptidylprolyl isomerase [Bacteroidota bacterium]